MEQKASNQELDVMELLARFCLMLKKNKMLVVLFPLLGVGIGYAVSNYSTETVQSSMMIGTNLISEDESIFLIDQLDKADTIQGLTRDQEQKIIRINYEVKKGDETNKHNTVYFKITTIINNKDVLHVLQNAIVAYLNNSEPVVRHREEREKLYNEMILKIDQELAALERVTKEIDNKTKATFLDPSNLFAKSVELYENKISYQVALKDIQSVHVVKGFGSLTKNVKMSTVRYLIIGFFFGIFFLVFTLFIKFFNGYYKQFEKTNLI